MLPGGSARKRSDARAKVKDLQEVPEKVKDWYHELPASRNPQATPLCMGILLAAQLAGIVLHVGLLSMWGQVTEVVTVELAAPEPDQHIVLLAIAVFARETKGGGTEILTQKYGELSSAQDPLFEGRWEALGRRMRNEETPLLSINRQLKEQYAFSQEEIATMGIVGMSRGDVEFFYTARTPRTAPHASYLPHRDKWYVEHDSTIFIKALQGTKPWAALGMMVQVPYELSERMMSGAGERWWPVEALYRETLSRPEEFAGPHYPLLLRAAGDFSSKTLKLGDTTSITKGGLSALKFTYDGTFEKERDPDRNGTILSHTLTASPEDLILQVENPLRVKRTHIDSQQ